MNSKTTPRRGKRTLPRLVRLLRCPFCGSKAKVVQEQYWYSVRCGGAQTVHPAPTRDFNACEVQPRTMGFMSAYEAARSWNKRAATVKDSLKVQKSAVYWLRKQLAQIWWAHTVIVCGVPNYSPEFKKMCAAAGVEPSSFYKPNNVVMGAALGPRTSPPTGSALNGGAP